jgi:hypothetical protein
MSANTEWFWGQIKREVWAGVRKVYKRPSRINKDNFENIDELVRDWRNLRDRIDRMKLAVKNGEISAQDYQDALRGCAAQAAEHAEVRRHVRAVHRARHSPMPCGLLVAEHTARMAYRLFPEVTQYLR